MCVRELENRNACANEILEISQTEDARKGDVEAKDIESSDEDDTWRDVGEDSDDRESSDEEHELEAEAEAKETVEEKDLKTDVVLPVDEHLLCAFVLSIVLLGQHVTAGQLAAMEALKALVQAEPVLSPTCAVPSVASSEHPQFPTTTTSMITSGLDVS
jgi:hypothetical protein